MLLSQHHKEELRYATLLSLALGFALLPQLLPYGVEDLPAWHAYAMASAIAIGGILGLSHHHRDQGGALALSAGVWLIIAPVLLGFTHAPVPFWSHLGVGSLVIGVIAWD